jgi:hypothetical protein
MVSFLSSVASISDLNLSKGHRGLVRSCSVASAYDNQDEDDRGEDEGGEDEGGDDDDDDDVCRRRRRRHVCFSLLFLFLSSN